MVRLKEKGWRVEPMFARFQFHYGTIKSELAICSLCDVLYFNSTMVRLKVRNPNLRDLLIHISIPLWYD